MEEQIILLKDFILRCPATHSEHQQAEGRLNTIARQHKQQVTQLQQQIDNLQKQLQKEQDTNQWLRDENEKLQNQLKGKENESETEEPVDRQQD